MRGSKARSAAIDAVRALGIVAVVAGHTWPVEFVRPLFYSWHVPLFFFLAGYFWSQHRSLKSELATRSRTLALPYLTWFVLIALVFVPVDTSFENFTLDRVLAPFSDGERSAMPYTTFWFVSALFATVILMRILSYLPAWVAWVVAIAGGIAGIVAGSTLAHTPLAVGSALACLIFVMLGRLARRLRPRVTRPGPVGFVLLVACAVLIASGLSAPVDIKQGDYGTPGLSVLVAAVVSLGLILVAESVFAHLSPAVHRYASLLAYAGFAVVLSHPLVFWLMETITPNVGGWSIFAVTITASWCIGLVALHSPASQWLTGVQRRSAQRMFTGSVSSAT